MKLLAILTALTLGLASATPSHTFYTLHRRLVDPSRSTAPFTPYGIVETDIDVASYALALQLGTGGVVPPKGRFVKAEGKEREGGETVDLDRAWVQLAVAVAGRDEEEWPRSAVRAVSRQYCFIRWVFENAWNGQYWARRRNTKDDRLLNEWTWETRAWSLLDAPTTAMWDQDGQFAPPSAGCCEAYTRGQVHDIADRPVTQVDARRRSLHSLPSPKHRHRFRPPRRFSTDSFSHSAISSTQTRKQSPFTYPPTRPLLQRATWNPTRRSSLTESPTAFTQT